MECSTCVWNVNLVLFGGNSCVSKLIVGRGKIEMDAFERSCSVDQLGDYLLEKGIPADIVTSFTDNQIDGECFTELSDEEVKDLVKPLGVAKKIIRLIKEVSPPLKEKTSPELFPPSQVCEAGLPVPSTLSSPNASEISTLSAKSSGDYTTSSKVPSKWRPSIMKAISSEKLTPDVRNEIVHDLVTHMYGFMEKPTSTFCKFAAQRLILKYQFMRDTRGTGYGSWEKKICDRVSNVLRKRKLNTDSTTDCTPPKRGRPRKAVACLEDRYPVVNYTAVDAKEEKLAWDSLIKEMASQKPRQHIFLPLMKTTFTTRRHFILYDATSVKSVLDDYPALKWSSTIKQEMELILSRPNALRSFTAEWTIKWAPAIVLYCKRLKRKEIVEVLAASDEEDEKLALNLLVLLFTQKKTPEVLKSVYEKCLIGEDPNEIAAAEPTRNSPRFAEFVVEDSESTYFVFVEQKTLCECSSFYKALFVWFSCHYVFHLSYCSSLADFCNFFQEFLFGLPLTGKRSASYLTTATDIQQLTVR